MIVFELIVLWIINSFKWFSYLAGCCLLYIFFRKEKNTLTEELNQLTILTLFLLIQPLAIAQIFNHYNIEGKLPILICCVAAIPGLFCLVKSNKKQ